MSLNTQIKETVTLAKEMSGKRFAAFAHQTQAQTDAEEAIEQKLIAEQGRWLAEHGKHEGGKWTAESIQEMQKAFSVR